MNRLAAIAHDGVRRIDRPGSGAERRRHDPRRHPPFADRHDGDQRIVAQGRRPDGDRGNQQGRRRPRQEDRSDRRGSGIEIHYDGFPDKAKKLVHEDKVAVIFGCWTSSSRKIILPLLEEENAPAHLPGVLRRERVLEERRLHGSDAQSASDSGPRLDPERQGREAKEHLPRGDRLHVPADRQLHRPKASQDDGPRTRRRGIRHVRPQRFRRHCRSDQTLESDRDLLHDQRRQQHQFLQRARRSGCDGPELSGDYALDR